MSNKDKDKDWMSKHPPEVGGLALMPGEEKARRNEKEIKELKEKNKALEERVSKLEKLLEQITRKVAPELLLMD